MENKSINELAINNKIASYSKEIGYDIEEVLSGLGYSYVKHEKGEGMDYKLYANGSAGKGYLVVSDGFPITFIEKNGQKNDTIIIFKENIQMVKHIYLPNKELGTIELGLDLENPTVMKYFSAPLYDYKYTLPAEDRKKVTPDDARCLNNTNPISAISEVNFWACEIRRNLAPKYDLTK